MSKGVRVAWHGLPRSSRDAMAGFLAAQAGAVKAEADRLLSVQGPPPSAPGEPPHMDTAELRASLYFRVDAAALTAEVGATAPQGLWTEIGTARMAPRPWLVPAVDNVAGGVGEVAHDHNDFYPGD